MVGARSSARTGGLGAANQFLVPFYFGGHDLLAHRVLQLLAGRYSSFPFGYFSRTPGVMCRKAEILVTRAVTGKAG